MSDITPEELRKLADDGDGVRWYGAGACINDALREAADTIERLAKHVERLSRALEDCRTPMPCSPWLTDIRLGVINHVAEAALQEQPNA